MDRLNFMDLTSDMLRLLGSTIMGAAMLTVPAAMLVIVYQGQSLITAMKIEPLLIAVPFCEKTLATALFLSVLVQIIQIGGSRTHVVSTSSCSMPGENNKKNTGGSAHA